MEYLLAAAFAFMLLVPIIIIAYTQSSRFSGDVSSAQIQKIGNEIKDAVDAVYYAGPPTKKTLKLYFPENIKSVDINEQTLLFTMYGPDGEYQYTVFTESNISGEIRPFTGIHTITVLAQDLQVNITDA